MSLGSAWFTWTYSGVASPIRWWNEAMNDGMNEAPERDKGPAEPMWGPIFFMGKDKGED
ncbi:MAG: hypothetical protein LC749_01590 [Actinobacteria bacterium]|nr:hypothetical protein [Actinomycetota bacterium]